MNIGNRLLRLFGHQEYLRFGIRDRIIRFFHHPDTAKSEDFVVPFFGVTYKGNFDTFLDWSVFYYGAYAGEELRLIKEVLETVSEPVVFDVGANEGHHALFMAQHSKQVFAFEPFERVSKKITEKINTNQIVNIKLCKFGLGESNSVESYFPPENANTGTGSFLANFANNASEPLRLEIRKGDDFVKETGLTRLDFIKMDIEGFEPFALSGLRQTLMDYRPVVFFEWNQNDIKSDAPKTIHTLFPPDYVFYEFVSDSVTFMFFRQSAYQLKPIHDLWKEMPDYGNVVAVPKEYIERVNALKPLPEIASRMKN